MTKHEKLFYMFILLVLAVVMLKIEQNVNDLKKRVYGLEKDYKIYEVNLTNLENYLVEDWGIIRHQNVIFDTDANGKVFQTYSEPKGGTE